MMYDYGTDNFLRNEIANAERYRIELESKLAGYRTNVAQTESKIAALDTRITDLSQLLDFHGLRNQDELAHAFANAVLDRDAEMQKTAREFGAGDLVNVSDPNHKLFGTRGSVVGSLYPDGVVVEYDNFGNTVTVTASQLMHHTEFLKQSAEQDARDAEAAADAMSTSERFEHDQADEFAQDAADEERYREENADRFYDDEHYDADDEDQDDDEDGDL